MCHEFNIRAGNCLYVSKQNLRHTCHYIYLTCSALKYAVIFHAECMAGAVHMNGTHHCTVTKRPRTANYPYTAPRQVIVHASTCCHMSYDSGPHHSTEVGSDVITSPMATCPMSPDLASRLRWASALPRVIWLWTSPPD
jgi:hypothetical protein